MTDWAKIVFPLIFCIFKLPILIHFPTFCFAPTVSVLVFVSVVFLGWLVGFFLYCRRRWYSGGPVSSFASISTVVEAQPYPKKGCRDGLSASVWTSFNSSSLVTDLCYCSWFLVGPLPLLVSVYIWLWIIIVLSLVLCYRKCWSKLLLTKQTFDLVFSQSCDIKSEFSYIICSYLRRLVIKNSLKCTETLQIFFDLLPNPIGIFY
jgi:hypothetical protein